jgi:hypothetical protein
VAPLASIAILPVRHALEPPLLASHARAQSSWTVIHAFLNVQKGSTPTQIESATPANLLAVPAQDPPPPAHLAPRIIFFMEQNVYRAAPVDSSVTHHTAIHVTLLAPLAVDQLPPAFRVWTPTVWTDQLVLSHVPLERFQSTKSARIVIQLAPLAKEILRHVSLVPSKNTSRVTHVSLTVEPASITMQPIALHAQAPVPLVLSSTPIAQLVWRIST